MSGIQSYGTYVPFYRLQRSLVSAVLGQGGGRGHRAVACFDEDATSMAVEAGRAALRTTVQEPTQLLLATASPPYLGKTNATAVHAALGLPDSTLAIDAGGAYRSGVGALVLASQIDQPTMVIASDVRTGLPGGSDESVCGDAAAAFVFGGGNPPIAEVVATASATGEFLDRWRLPGATADRVWEERFGEHAYRPLADAAFADALKQANLTPSDVDHLAVASVHGKAARAFAQASGVDRAAIVDDLSATVGNTGTAHAGLLLTSVLDIADADRTIALVTLADGVTVVILRTTAELPSRRQGQSVNWQVFSGDDRLPYATYLSWRGLLDREPPRRPDPQPPAAPPMLRDAAYKYAFAAGRCDDCGTRQVPPARVCRVCHAVDRSHPEPLSEAGGTIATFTVDHLAVSPNPPVVVVMVDLDGGGRFRCQLTETDPATVAIGDRVELTFRRTGTSDGIHNYFWKARPVRSTPTALFAEDKA